MNHELLIYGASGHAKVVIDIVEHQRIFKIIGLLDDNPERRDSAFFGYRILGGHDVLAHHKRCGIVIAIGKNVVRKKLQEKSKLLGYELISTIHPSAQIARDVLIGAGTVVMAQAAINSDTVIGDGVIINTGATIDHDCRIGAFAHLSPGVHLAGNVTVGALTHIGIGACAIPGVKIGENTIVGAGATVIQELPDNIVAVGVPAHVIKPREGD